MVKKLNDYKEGECGCDHCECKGKEKMIKVYFCPRCESKDVGFVFRLGNAFGIVPRMECKKCGFHSSVFPQLVVNADKLKKKNTKIRNKKRNKK